MRCLKRSICPSGALAASRGERISSVLSCKQSVHFWFGNFSEPFKWLLSWPCQLQGKKNTCDHRRNSQKPFRSSREVYLIGKVVSLPVTSRNTTKNSANLPKEWYFSQCLPRKSNLPKEGYFSQCLPQEIWKNQWLGFGQSLCSWLLLCCHILGNVRQCRRRAYLY